MDRRCLLLLLVFSGCTYSFNPSLYSHIRSIAIPVFENETVKYGLAEPFTNKLIEAFMEDGSLSIQSEKEADSILNGKIVKYEKLPLIYDEYERVSSLKVVIRIEAQFVDRVRDRILWTREFEDWGRYAADEDEEKGIEETIEKLKNRIVGEIIEAW